MEFKADVRVYRDGSPSMDIIVEITSDDLKELAESKALSQIEGMSAQTLTIEATATFCT